MQSPDSLSLFSLACHRDIELSLTCLVSLTARCKDPHTLTLLSDGSLTPEDTARLGAALPNATILTRAELDPQILPALKEFPLCRKYREWCPWALKLLDIPLYAKSDFCYIDGDILFLRDFTGLSSAADVGINIVSMHSYANIYSFALSDKITLAPQIPIVSRLNAGFLFVRPQAFNLDLIERFLHDSEKHKRPFLWEQTAWAVLAAHTSSAYFSSSQIAFPQKALDGHRRPKFHPVALHFVGGTRHLLPEIQASAAQWTTDPAPVSLVLEKSAPLTRTSLALDLVRHRFLVKRCRRAGIFK